MRRQEKQRAADHRGSSRGGVPLELSDRQCIGVLVLLVVIFFHKILLGQAFFWEDFIYQNYPFRNFAATSLAQGELPLWNPYTFNGMPFLADIQTTVLYLPSLLLTLFVRDGALNFYWLEVMIIAHFVLAGVGMYFLAKSFGLRNAPSLFAGAAYMLSGYMIVHAIHQQNVTLVAWYPLVVLFFRKALSDDRWVFVFLCAVILGHSILAGYPQLSLYLYFFLALYFVYEMATRFNRNHLVSRPALVMAAKAVVIVVLSVLLAMIQLLPTFELSELSQRAHMTFEKASEGSLAFSQLATLWFPKLFGTAGANGYEYFGPGAYWWFWETCIYLGALPLLLIGVSIVNARNNKDVMFLFLVLAFSLLFALGDNFILWRLFYEFVPGFSRFRIPARMGILTAFSGALLSAFALHSILYGQKSVKENKLVSGVLMVLVAVGAVLFMLIVAGSFSGRISAQEFLHVASAVKTSSTISLLLMLTSAGLLLALTRGALVRVAPIALVGLFFIDMFVFGERQNTGSVNPAEYFKQTSDLVTYLKKEGEKEIFRVNTRNAQGMLMDRNQGMIDRIFMMEGYTPLALQRAYAPLASSEKSFDLLNVKYKAVADGQSQRLETHRTYLPRAFFLYDVKVIRDSAEFMRALQAPDFDHRTTALLEKRPAVVPTAPSTKPAWDARVAEYGNNRIVVDATTTHDGLLVLSEIFYPGWEATIDGAEAEVLQTNYNLRGVVMKAGSHRLIMTFNPSSFRNGMWISLTTLVISVVGGFVSLRRKRT